MSELVILKNKNCRVIIEKGELVSFQKDTKEYIHQKGSKGWGNSDIEMFPVIGPLSKNNFKVHTKKGDAIQDQHGFLRELEYTLISSSDTSAKLLKTYKKNTQIQNSKFPKKSTEEKLFWPFDFNFEKQFHLENNELKITFVLTSEKGMPFMVGYHPAFLLSDTGTETIVCKGEKITLDEVFKAGHNAFPLLNSDKIILENTDRNSLEISMEGFDNLMLWTPSFNMLCVEPITQYTSYTDEKFSEKNMRLSEGENIFSMAIKIL
jgi:galactose mutarotase-like enzyme